MKITIKSILLIITLFLIGCQSASNYLHKTILHTNDNRKKLNQKLSSCDLQVSITIVAQNRSEFLKMVELALLEFYQFNYKESQKYFQKAINIYQFNETKPQIALSNIVVSDYVGEGYDKVLLHNYNALNYLMRGDLDGAKVETKNSNFIQKKERDRFYLEIEKYKNGENRYSLVLNRYEKLFDNVNSLHTPYQNPFAYYISALLYEEDNQCSEARIDIINALKYYRDSPILKDKLKLYKSSKLNSSDKRVEIFFDIGKSPLKKQVKIPVKIDENRKKMLYLPTFELYISDIDKIIITDSHDRVIAKSSTLSDINAIKINEFKAKLPSLISKVILESGKEVLSEALGKNSLSASAIYKTLNVVYSQNNLLTWSVLPQRIDVLSFLLLESEKYRLKVIDKNGKILDNKRLNLKCLKKQKNCYQYYLLRDNKFCNIIGK